MSFLTRFIPPLLKICVVGLPLFVFGQNDSLSYKDSLSYSEKLNSGQYFPYLDFSEVETEKLPIELRIGIQVSEIRDLDIKKTDFYTVFEHTAIASIDSIVLTNTGDTVRVYQYNGPYDLYRVIYPESDQTWLGAYLYDRVYSEITNDSVTRWISYLESQFPHKWDLRAYPFDEQKLRYVFETYWDTSVLKIIPDPEFQSSVLDSTFLFLKDGLQITGIDHEISYTQLDEDDFVDGYRRGIGQRLIFNVNVDRRGSFLYFKLFFGGFLSFLISYLAFYTDSSFFETRITLSIGGIFGAVGNKYVVENTMPAIQVLTKADIINNLVIVFIILNIFIVIGQQTKKLPLGPFEQNMFASRFMMIS